MELNLPIGVVYFDQLLGVRYFFSAVFNPIFIKINSFIYWTKIEKSNFFVYFQSFFEKLVYHYSQQKRTLKITFWIHQFNERLCVVQKRKSIQFKVVMTSHIFTAVTKRKNIQPTHLPKQHLEFFIAQFFAACFFFLFLIFKIRPHIDHYCNDKFPFCFQFDQDCDVYF